MTECEQVDIEILRATQKQGVDVIINAVNERQIKQSTQCLKSFGAFIQITESGIQAKTKIGK